jgi:hypothetical protein
MGGWFVRLLPLLEAVCDVTPLAKAILSVGHSKITDVGDLSDATCHGVVGSKEGFGRATAAMPRGQVAAARSDAGRRYSPDAQCSQAARDER